MICCGFLLTGVGLPYPYCEGWASSSPLLPEDVGTGLLDLRAALATAPPSIKGSSPGASSSNGLSGGQPGPLLLWS